jgi:hypothetical protein
MTAPPIQTYRTHRRFVPGYHFVTSLFFLLYLGWTGVQLVKHPGVGGAIALLFAVGVVLLYRYVRQFPLAVQDRVIRLEEQLRLARLLPADLQNRIDSLSADQLIALRFAADGEVAELVRKVLAEGITDREAIKRLITTWRPDAMRA